MIWELENAAILGPAAELENAAILVPQRSGSLKTQRSLIMQRSCSVKTQRSWLLQRFWLQLPENLLLELLQRSWLPQRENAAILSPAAILLSHVTK